MPHILSARDLLDPPDLIWHLFRRADEFDSMLKIETQARYMASLFPLDVMISFFGEESTRTRFSSEVAASLIGLRTVSSDNAEAFSSLVKGGTVEDEIRMLSEYPRVSLIVFRHAIKGTAAKVAAVSRVPIINAGDGAGEHPTQGGLDARACVKHCPDMNGKTIVFVGDLRYGRTIRSLLYLLVKLFPKVRCIFVSHPSLRLADDLRAYLVEKGVHFIERDRLSRQDLAVADVVYVTRTQKERLPYWLRLALRLPLYERRIMSRYEIGPEEVAAMRERARILHPFPRNNEIAASVDAMPQAGYFEQAEGGVTFRAALFEYVINEHRKRRGAV